VEKGGGIGVRVAHGCGLICSEVLRRHTHISKSRCGGTRFSGDAMRCGPPAVYLSEINVFVGGSLGGPSTATTWGTCKAHRLSFRAPTAKDHGEIAPL
jgi:hypothetical protein